MQTPKGKVQSGLTLTYICLRLLGDSEATPGKRRALGTEAERKYNCDSLLPPLAQELKMDVKLLPMAPFPGS